jgi:kynurenine formamidase
MTADDSLADDTVAGRRPGGVSEAGSGIPSYRDLPELGGLGVRHSRGVLPPGEGTLSFIAEAGVIAAVQTVSVGTPIPLNLAVNAFDPPLFGRAPLTHRVIEASRNDAEDIIDAFNPQSSSQLDGLAHVRAREHGYYDGSTDLASAGEALGMQHWAARGIVARGVLLDLPRYWAAGGRLVDPFEGFGVTPDDLESVAAAEGVDVRPGDVLLIRTEWAARYLALPAGERVAVAGWTGLVASEEMAEFLWNHRVALVGSDNPAVENGPGDPAIGSLHRRLLPALGLSLLELLDLEVLAERCAELGRWEFLFVSVPLNLHGAVSSPANAMAVL